MSMLEARYPKTEYAFFKEVPNGTGSQCNRHCDAMAMSLWPSRGLFLTGFELKVSRTDWVKELKQPGKAEPIAQYCDFWYLVVGSKDIVHAGELPPNWGMLAPVAGKLKVITEATKLEPIEIPRKFLAALMRVTQAQISRNAVALHEKQKEYQRGYEQGRSSRDFEVSQLRRAIEGFEKHAEVTLTAYNGGSLAEALKLVQETNGLAEKRRVITMIRKQAAAIVTAIDKSIDQDEEHWDMSVSG